MILRFSTRLSALLVLLLGLGNLGAQTPILRPAPRLDVVPLPPGRVRLEWPSAAEGFRLEQAPTLEAMFRPVEQMPVKLGDRWNFEFPLSGRAGFFRLRFNGLTHVTETSPGSGMGGVSVTRETVLRFNSPLHTSAVIPVARFYAEAAGRRVLARPQLSDDRLTATLFYLEPLPGATRVAVTFDANGLKDTFGVELDGDGDGVPGGVLRFAFETLGVEGVTGTAVFGRVFASELIQAEVGIPTLNRPLPGVTITVDGAEESLRTVTDAEGNFVLSPVPAGDFFVHIDGRTSPLSTYPAGTYYPAVGKRWSAVAGRSVPAGGGGEIFLPLIRPGTLQAVSPTTSTLVTFPPDVVRANPALEGVSLSVPANALYSDNGTRGGKVGIAPVSPERLPSPLPLGLEFPLVITVQTDGAQNFDQPVPVCFPNLPDPATGGALPPGAKTALWSFNHDLGNWEIVGPATISADGRFACSDPGFGIRQPGWHGVSRATQGQTRGGGAAGGATASVTPSSPCDWNALAKFFGDRYEEQKNTANGALALQLKCIAEKACQNQATWGGGFIKSVMCAEKQNPNGAQPGFFPGLSIFPFGQLLDAACRNLPVPETGDAFADANLKLLLNELCAPLAGFLHHFVNELLPYFALFCDQLNDADHDALFEQGVVPCFQQLTADTRLSDFLAEVGSFLVPTFAGLLREVTQATCLLGGRSVADANGGFSPPPPVPLPPPPERGQLFLSSLASLGTLKVTVEPGDVFDLKVGESYSLSVRARQADTPPVQLEGHPATRYHVFGDPDLVEISPAGRLTVKGAFGPIVNVPTLLYVLAMNGTNFGIGQFILTDRDADGDGLTDATETRLGLDPQTSNAGIDTDLDGISDLREALMGTDPLQFDTDGDGVEDGRELRFGMNPRDASLASAPPQALVQRFLLEDLDTGRVLRGVTSGQGLLQELILASGRHYRLTLLVPSTLFLGSVEFTSAEPGLLTEIPRVVVVPPEGPDADGDGLVDLAELVVGSDLRRPDTDADGVLDSAEVVQGTDPSGPDQPANGVVHVVRLPGGLPQDVDAFGNLVAVTQRPGGVALYNAFRGMAPTLIAQVNTEGEAHEVSLGSDSVVVADGSAGLAFFRLAELPTLNRAHRIELSGDCRTVEFAAGRAYAGLFDGRVLNVDLLSGGVLEEVLLQGGEIMDMALLGDHLYVLTYRFLSTLLISEGRMQLLGQIPHDLTMGAGGRRLRLQVSERGLVATETQGYKIFDLSDPDLPVAREGRRFNEFGWRQIAPDGFGLGVAVAGASSLNDSPHDLSTYDLLASPDRDNLVQTLTLRGRFTALALYGGQAYAVDDSDRLSVVKYRDFDRRTNAPSVQLTVPSGEGGVSDGRPVTVMAGVSDDVAVRQVEFYVNGERQAIDGNFPFEHRFVVEGRTAGRTHLTLQAKAIDTAGNVGWSKLLNIAVVADASPPRVLRITPGEGSRLGIRRFNGVSVMLDDAIEPGSVSPQSVELFTPGADLQFGTLDDQRVEGIRTQLLQDGHTLLTTHSSSLLPGEYRIRVSPTLRNLAGLSSGSPRFSVFTLRPDVLWIKDGDGRWEDAANWSSGAPPGPEDSVVIDRPGVDVTVTLAGDFSFTSQIVSLHCAETLVISAGRALFLDDSSEIQRLRLMGGGVDGTGTLTIARSLEWEGGSIGRFNLLNLPSGCEAIIGDTGFPSLQSKLVALEGSLSLRNFLVQDGVELHVVPGGRLEFVGAHAGLVRAAGGFGRMSQILNGGTLTKKGEGNLDLTQVTLFNDGSLAVEEGQVTLGEGRTSGRLEVASGARAVYYVGGEHVLVPGLRLSGPGSIDFLNGFLVINEELRLPRLSFGGGTFIGRGRVVIEERLDWAGGTFACEGGLKLLPAATAEVPTSSTGLGLGAAIDGTRLENEGTLSLHGRLFAVNGASVENQPAALIELWGDAGIFDPTGSGGGEAQLAGIAGAPPTVLNRGVLRKVSGVGKSELQRVRLINEAEVEVIEGTLSVTMGGGGGIEVQSGSARPAGITLSGVGESGFRQTQTGSLRLHLVADPEGAGPSAVGLRVDETASLAGRLTIEVDAGASVAAGQRLEFLEAGLIEGDFAEFRIEGVELPSLELVRVPSTTQVTFQVQTKP